MTLWKKRLTGLISFSSIVFIILIVLLFSENDLQSQQKSETEKESASLEAAPTVWDDLTVRQQDNGSWDNDLETTVIASNALTQNIDLMNEGNEKINWQMNQSELEEKIESNTQSVEDAQKWTVSNYEKDVPLTTQNHLSYQIGVAFRQQNIDSESIINLSQDTNDVILSFQSPNGSWYGDVQQTSFSIYVLKRSNLTNFNAITAGESWLISRQENNSWGGILNDTFALLALHNSTYNMEPVAERLITQQWTNGSFGDLETTAWAVIALSLYDVPGSREAATYARQWLSQQENVSDRHLALISLAESEYLTNEATRIEGMRDIHKDKGPPTLLLVFLGIVGGIIVILSIMFVRLSERNVFDGVRKNIYDFVKEHPGVNQNALMRRLDISSSSIRHHLKILKRYDHVLAYNDGRYIRYYANRNGYSIYTNGNNYKEIISVLRKHTAANIVKYIMENPNITQSNLAEALNLHPSTVHWHTKLLLSSKIISVKRAGKSVQYQINGPLDIDRLLSLAS